MLCLFLLYNTMTQPYVTYVRFLLDLPRTPTPSYPFRSSENPELYSSFPPATCFTHGGVYMSLLLSQLISPYPFPTVSTRPSS